MHFGDVSDSGGAALEFIIRNFCRMKMTSMLNCVAIKSVCRDIAEHEVVLFLLITMCVLFWV